MVLRGTFTDEEACPVCRGPVFLDIHERCSRCQERKVLSEIHMANGMIGRALRFCVCERGHEGEHSFNAKEA